LSFTGETVRGDTGNETIFNSGTVTGGIMLGAGNNAFNNLAGATFNAGPTVDLGAAGLLTNTGMLAPGGRNSAPVTTALNGNLVQTAGGALAVDVRNGAADRINVTGTAALAGTVLPTVNGLAAPTQQFTILSAAGGTTNNGITLAVQDTAVLDYSLLFPNPNDMVLAVTANFLPTGANLTPNQRVTAGHLQGALGAGGGNLGGLLGYLSGFMDVGAYAKALDRLHPEPYLAQVQSGLLASLAFTDGLMSCPTAASPNASAFVAEGQCAWARMGGRTLNVTRSTANIGYDDTSWGGSAGVQVALAPSWFGSLAFG
jgi:outer membrane autotransporter protein